MLDSRRANISDHNFLCSCILYGARKGHYSFNADNPEMVSMMRREIQSVITCQRLLDCRPAEARVYTQNNTRVGLLIMCDHISSSSAHEIYALSVAKKYQHHGYGSQILDGLLHRYVYENLYARCFSASMAMSKLLMSKGFHVESLESEFKNFVRESVDSLDIPYLPLMGQMYTA